MDLRYEPTAYTTPEGKPQGFIVRSAGAPEKVIGYAEWLTQWTGIPAAVIEGVSAMS